MRNILLVGDELVAGHGDPKALGWAGRVAARTLPAVPDARFHGLGVPSETTGEMASRWDEEALRRLRHAPKGSRTYVLFAIGRADLRRSVTPTMTRLNLANALDRAAALGYATMVAGPPPTWGDENQRIAELAAICEDAATRRDAPYIDMYGPLVRHDQWAADMATGNGDLPGQAGYGLMAWLVLNSTWHEWLGASAPAVS